MMRRAKEEPKSKEKTRGEGRRGGGGGGGGSGEGKRQSAREKTSKVNIVWKQLVSLLSQE